MSSRETCELPRSDTRQSTSCRVRRPRPTPFSSGVRTPFEKAGPRVPGVFLLPYGSNKFQSDTFGDDLFLVCLLKQPAHRLLPLAAVVERQVVHVHPDKPVYTLRVEASRKLNRVGGSLFPMIQSVLDAIADILRDLLHNFSPEIAFDDVAAERQDRK